MLNNSDKNVNQGCNLKWKPGNSCSEQVSKIEFLRNRTIGKPLLIKTMALI